MTQICCFVQRQDGHVVGLVDKDSEGKVDLSTARLILGDSEDGEDEEDAALRILEQVTKKKSDYALRIASYNGTEIFDMEVNRFNSFKTDDPNVVLMWIHPWHLSQGPTKDIAMAGFAFNDTRVVEPPVYEGKKNTDFVGDPNATGGAGVLGQFGGATVIGVPPGGSVSVGVHANGGASISGGVPLSGGNQSQAKQLTQQELETLKPWDDDADGVDHQTLEKLWENVKSSDFVFAIPDANTTPPDQMCVVITPASYWYANQAWYDQSFLSDIFDHLVSEEEESSFSPVNNLTYAQVRHKLLALGVMEEPNLLV